MSSLQVPELRLPAGDGGGGAGSGTGSKGTAPLLLVPPSNVPRRRHSWICRNEDGNKVYNVSRFLGENHEKARIARALASFRSGRKHMANG
ncbi:hypothetical protein HZH66_007127 [Vespula vulgaris]|uniref:Uncharacterized protein n=1 Tax=Vespula vulgaris TaxID=7454 RepID=A0A834JY18_VESVU|nr:hypothetical protein HZH66_007127 [Vespula vulgaris]